MLLSNSKLGLRLVLYVKNFILIQLITERFGDRIGRVLPEREGEEDEEEGGEEEAAGRKVKEEPGQEVQEFGATQRKEKEES